MTRNNDEAMPWERVVPPLWWAKAGMYIVADRHLPDGTRQHMVSGSVTPGVIIANAEIVGDADTSDALFSDKLSHLSAVDRNAVDSQVYEAIHAW